MFFDGFEERTVAISFSQWVTDGAAPNLLYSTTFRHQTPGGYGGLASATYVGGGVNSLECNTLSPQHRWTHVWLRNEAGFSPGFRVLLQGADAAAVQFRDGLQDIVIRRGNLSGTIIATSASGVWIQEVGFYCWIDWQIANVGGFIGVYLNGNTIPTVSFAGDTTAAAADGWDQFGLGVAGQTNYDDVVILTDAEKTARYGAGVPQAELYVWLYPPTANVTTGQTPSAGTNFQCVDDIPASTAQYNYTSVVGVPSRDTFSTVAPAFTILSVGGVKVGSYAAREGTIYFMNNVLISGATTSVSPDYTLAASAQYVWRNTYHGIDPNTGLLWTPGAVASAIFGNQWS